MLDQQQEQQEKAAARNVRFRQLQKMFVKAAIKDIAEMTELLRVSTGDLSDGDAGRRFRKLAHDLRGTGGGYEFPAISDTAAIVEDHYLNGASAGVLRESLALLRRAVEAAGAALEADGGVTARRDS